MPTYERIINIARLGDSWTATPQPPLPAVTDLVTAGWPEIVKLRNYYDAVDHFPSTEDYAAFVAEFGEPPVSGTQVD